MFVDIYQHVGRDAGINKMYTRDVPRTFTQLSPIVSYSLRLQS